MDYDDMAEQYDEAYTSPLCERENQAVKELLEDCIDLERPLLDLGCGTGLLLDMIEPSIYLGCDPAHNMLDILLDKHPTRTVTCARFEDLHNIEGMTVVSLFGSPSYVPPAQFNFEELDDYFLMFYRQGYEPVSHKQYGINTPYFGHSLYGMNGRSLVFEMTDYVFVTSMEVNHESILRRNGF